MTDTANSPQEIVKNTIEQLTPKDRKTVLTEIIRNRLPDTLQKDLLAEAAQTLPGGVKKDAVAEAAQTLPTEARKEVVAEATRTLPAEVKRDVIARTVQGMSTEDRKDIATRAFHDLSAKDRQDIAGNPSQRVTDIIWLMTVGTFAAVLLLSAITLLYVSINPPASGTDSIQVILPVFTSIAGILAGFIGGRASAGG
jgi:hypothetical protein